MFLISLLPLFFHAQKRLWRNLTPQMAETLPRAFVISTEAGQPPIGKPLIVQARGQLRLTWRLYAESPQSGEISFSQGMQQAGDLLAQRLNSPRGLYPPIPTRPPARDDGGGRQHMVISKGQMAGTPHRTRHFDGRSEVEKSHSPMVCCRQEISRLSVSTAPESLPPIPARSPARDDHGGRRHTVISKGQMAEAPHRPFVISTEAGQPPIGKPLIVQARGQLRLTWRLYAESPQSGEISLSHGMPQAGCLSSWGGHKKGL